MEDDTERSWHFRHLRRSLRELAAAGFDQPTLFGDAPASADQLALDFDHWAAVVREAYQGELSGEEAAALVALERKLATMSRDGAEFDAELWTDAAMRTSEHWSDVRSLAASALDAFGWRVAAAVPDSPDVPADALLGEAGE